MLWITNIQIKIKTVVENDHNTLPNLTAYLKPQSETNEKALKFNIHW